MRTRITILLLMLTGAVFGQIGSSPVNDDPCNAIDLNGPDLDTSVVIFSSNINSTADPTFVPPVPVCINNFNTVYYSYTLPTRYSQITAKLTPMDSQNVNMVFLRDTYCASGTQYYLPSSSSCTTMDLAADGSITSDMGTACLPADSPTTVLIRIAGQEGTFKLEVDVVEPTCSDGCENGNEIGVDEVPEIPINIIGVDDRICGPDDSVMLQIPSLVLAPYFWSTGEIGSTIWVSEVGLYTVSAFDEFGCEYKGAVVVRTDTSCIWPGETNRDGMVNARDILPIGRAFGFSGPPRSGPALTTTFTSLDATPWVQSLTGVYAGVNYNNADCNGDGTVDEMDVIVVQQNYGGVAFFRGAGERPGDPLLDPHVFIEFEEDMLEAGDTLRAVIHLGDSAMPVDTLYQFAFHLNFPSALVDTNSLNISFDTSWVGSDTLQNIGFYKYLPSDNYIDISYSRTDQQNTNGYGPIMEMDIVIIDDLGGKLVADQIMHFNFSSEIFLSVQGDSIDIYPEEDSVIISQYCFSRGNDSDSSYIYGIGFNQYKLPTLDNGGYLDTMVASGFLRQGSTYTFRTAPGYPGFPVGGGGTPTDMEWKIWADFNHDGFLKEDDGELLIHKISDSYIGEPVTIPIGTNLGPTIFRYQMKLADGIPPEPCADFQYGEVEDWIIEIKQAASRSSEDVALSGSRLSIHPNPVGVSPENCVLQLAMTDTIDFDLATIEITNLAGALVYSEELKNVDGAFNTNLIEVEVPVGTLPNGFYLVSFHSKAGTYTTKLLVEK